MSTVLETLSWIAAIIGVPLAIVGWFVSGTRRANRAVTSAGGTSIAGDLHVENAGIVAGHNSQLNISLAVNSDAQDSRYYERRYVVFEAVGKALNETLRDKMTSAETFQTFCKAITDSQFLLGGRELVAYSAEIRKRAAKFQAIAKAMEPLPPGDEKARASVAAGEQRLWLIAQIDGLPKKFESVLRN